jgi:riboflavin biosynthesis pyrimidine reductase
VDGKGHRRSIPGRTAAGIKAAQKFGVSYIFAGEQYLDLGLALEILNRELGVKRLLVEGGGTVWLRYRLQSG